MKLYLSGFANKQFLKEYLPNIPYVLESFYYVKPWQYPYIAANKKEFLLDSGAFTFFKKKNNNIDYATYIDNYIRFINEHDIQNFFELDIDCIIGYPAVLDIRKKLEQQTQKKTIPVFHNTLGSDEWRRMCANYAYVSIGSLDIKRQKKETLYKLMHIAKQEGAKVHGLGYTRADMREVGFYSVDSTSWTFSGRYGRLNYLDKNAIRGIKKPDNVRLKDPASVTKATLEIWLQYQKLLERGR